MLRPACDMRRARGTELPGRPAAGRGLLLLRCGRSELCRLAWASGLGPGASPETCDATEQQPPRTLAVRLPGLWVRIPGQGWYAADGPSVLLGHNLSPSPGVGSAGQHRMLCACTGRRGFGAVWGASQRPSPFAPTRRGLRPLSQRRQGDLVGRNALCMGTISAALCTSGGGGPPSPRKLGRSVPAEWGGAATPSAPGCSLTQRRPLGAAGSEQTFHLLCFSLLQGSSVFPRPNVR